MGKESEKLRGEELASYVEDHRGEFQGNGDALCLAPGYGKTSSDGSQVCNFTAFVKALANVVEIKNEENFEE